jgi:FtsH-binding integral membrane protein
MMLFGVSMDTRLISIIGLLIFTGLTAWDMQKLGQISRFSMDDATSEKIGVYFALELYLDFINIFLYILRLLGNNRRN